MAKMNPAADNTNRKTLPVEGKRRSAEEKSKSQVRSKATAASNVAKPLMTQDTPDFTVLDVKQEEFEQVGDTNKYSLF